MMNWIWRLLGRGDECRRRFVEVPEVCGERLSLGEVRAALMGAQGDSRVRALLQVLWLRHEEALERLLATAAAGQDTRHEAGGVQALEELLEDAVKLLEGKVMPPGMQGWFGGDEEVKR